MQTAQNPTKASIWNRRSQFSRLAMVALAAFGASQAVHAAPITWGTATTISADADILNVGALNYAYDLSNTATAVNGVSFAAGNSASSLGGGNVTMSGFSSVNNTTFNGGTTNPWNGLSTSYKDLLKGAAYGSSAAATVTLNNLASGHVYSTQVWVNDSRTGGSATRTETITSTGGNTISLDYNSTDALGGVGQYTLGSFTADATTQAFTLDGDASTQMNAIQVRDVTGVWSGQTDGNWADASANFTGGSTWTTVSGLVSTIYFADTDGLNNAVANSTVSIQSGGVSTGTVVFQNNSVNYTLTNAGANGITGSTAVTKSGSGTVTLTGANSYSGATTISAGTLQIGNAGTTGTLGTGAIANAGTLVFNRTNTYTLASGNLVTGAGAVTLANTGAVATSVDNQFNTTGALNFGATNGSTTVSSLDLSNGSSTFGSLTVQTLNTGNNSIALGAGKTLTVNGGVTVNTTGISGTQGANLTFNPGGAVPTSTFTVTGANTFLVGQDSATSTITRTGTVDMRNLGAFNAGTSTTAMTNFVVGNYVQASGTNYNDGGIYKLYLAPSSKIYSTSFGVGDKGTGSQPGQYTNTLYLGTGTTGIHSTTITVGEVGAIDSLGSTVKWDAGVTSGALTLNGTGATTAVTNMYVGYKTDTASSGAGVRLGTVDLSNGTVTGSITNLYVGYKTTGSDSGTSPATTTGVFKLGAGTAGASSNLTIANLTLASSVSTAATRNNPVNGTFQLDGGTVSVTNNVVLTNESAYDQRTGTLTINGGAMTVGGNITSGITRATSTLTVSGGTLDMTSGDIGTATNPVSAFNFYSGTLSNAGSIHAGTATVRTVTADDRTIALTSPGTFSVTGAGGFTLGADAGATSTHKLTLTGTGSFAVKNAAANVVIGVAQGDAARNNTATLDLSGLSGVVLGDGITAINELRVGFGQTTNGSLLLSNTANTINANVVSIGHSNGSNNTGTPAMTLGTGTNLIAADTINFGLSKANGTLKFASQTAGSPGTVTITDQAGTGGAAIVIGSNNGTNTAANNTGLLDLRGHTATVTAGTVTLGYSTNTGGGSPQGTLSFDAGTFTATTLNMATLAAASASGNVTGTLNIGGGAFTVGTLGVANKSAAGTGTATGNINVSGGSLTVNTAFTLATQATAGFSSGTLTITGTGLVTSNVNILDGGGTGSTSKITLNGGTLDMTGKNIGDATNIINTLEFQSGTLKNVASINGTGGLTKTTSGTLTLDGTNTYSGATAVTAGTLALGATRVLPAASAVSLAAGTVFNTAAQASFAMPATQTFTITVNGAGAGSSGRITADGLNISAGVVAFNVVGALDDAAYILASYTSKTGAAFASVTPPTGYTIDYSYAGGTQIALVPVPVAGFDSWIDDFTGLSDVTAGGDPDGDGMKNVLEYVLNGNPGVSDPAILPTLDASGANFVFSFTRREESANDTTQVFQYGSDLSGWTDVSITAPTGAGVALGTPSGGLQSVTVTIPKGGNTSMFGRLTVTKP